MKTKQKKILICTLLVLILTGMSGCASKDQLKNWQIVSQSDENIQNEDIETAEVLMQTEYQSYNANVEKISFSIQNMTDASLEFGLEYKLQYYDGTNWYQVPFVENAAFNEIAVVLAPQETYSQELNFSMFDLDVIDGTYRIVKTFNNHIYYAVFNIGETTVSTARVEFKDGKVENAEEIITFLNKVDMGMSCFLDIVRYTKEGEPVYQTISFVKDFDDSTYFQVVEDASAKNPADSAAKKISYYPYLSVEDGDVILSNYASTQYNETLYDNTFMAYKGYFLFSCDEVKNGAELEGIITQMEEDRSDNHTGYMVYSEDGNYYVGLPSDKESGLTFTVGTAGYGAVETLPNPDREVSEIIGVYWKNDNETFVIGYADEEGYTHEMELNIRDYVKIDTE